MKKLSVLFAVLVCTLVFTIKANAQDPKDYFVGKWSLTTFGTPNGDANMTVKFYRVDGKMKGCFVNSETGKAGDEFSKIEEKENNLTFYFTATSYKVYVFIEKKDDNNVTGNMLDMFDVTGERVPDTAVTTTK